MCVILVLSGAVDCEEYVYVDKSRNLFLDSFKKCTLYLVWNLKEDSQFYLNHNPPVKRCS